MPYEIVRRRSKYCVKKEGGAIVPGGCHDTHAKAERQMAALYASESKQEHPNDPEFYAIVPDREKPSTWKLPLFNFEEVSGAIQALSPAGFRGNRVQIPRGVSRESVINKISRRIGGVQATDEAKQQLRDRLNEIKSYSVGIVKIFKPAENDPRRMFLITSNSYEDREGETITTKALQGYVDGMWNGNEFLSGKQDLLFGHGGAAIGHIGWADMVGPFLVEIAEERDTPYAKRKWDYIEEHPDIDWGASHGFEYVEADKQADGTYQRIYKFETSIIEVDRAANLLTLAEVI